MFIPDGCMEWVRLHRTDVQTKADYVDSIEEDLALITHYLPDKVDSILDIGCGMAGIDVFLAKRYPAATLNLLDGDGPASNWRGLFKDTMEPFNSREAANALLAANGVTGQVWHDIGTQDLKVDLVISLLSWGWHYPLSNYRVEAKTHIADLRYPQEMLGVKMMAHPKDKGWRCVW